MRWHRERGYQIMAGKRGDERWRGRGRKGMEKEKRGEDQHIENRRSISVGSVRRWGEVGVVC